MARGLKTLSKKTLKEKGAIFHRQKKMSGATVGRKEFREHWGIDGPGRCGAGRRGSRGGGEGGGSSAASGWEGGGRREEGLGSLGGEGKGGGQVPPPLPWDP